MPHANGGGGEVVDGDAPAPGPFVEHPRDEQEQDDRQGVAATVATTTPSALRPWLIVAASLAAGALLGLLLPADARHLPDPRYARASNCLGWATFSAWTVSFWPQILSNRRRRSVDGLSLDFVALNVLGFFCYATFSSLLYWNVDVGDEFKRRTGASPRGAAVQLNDVAFAAHALFAASLTALQCAWYGGGWRRRRGGGSISAPPASSSSPEPSRRRNLAPATRLALCAALLVVGAHALAARAAWDSAGAVAERARRACGAASSDPDDPSAFSADPPAPWTLLDVAYTLSYVKMAVTLTKYAPQAAFNCARRSTVGWSVTNILLDFTGGLSSLAQQLLGAWWWRDLRSVISANPVRFALSVASLGFDFLFMIQHYVLYRAAWQGEGGQQQWDGTGLAGARRKRRGRAGQEDGDEVDEGDEEERQRLRGGVGGGGSAAAAQADAA